MRARGVTQTFILFSFYLLVLIPPTNGQTKQKTPLEGLRSIPLPPKTIQEALRRCPNERDTLVHSLAEDLEYYIEEKGIEISKPGSGPPDLYGWKPMSKQLKDRQFRARENLLKEVQQNERDIPRLLGTAVDSSAAALLVEVRIIGQELDVEIKNCQAMKSGYDTVCVESAETAALDKRQHSSSNFLRNVSIKWSGLLDSLKTIMTTRQQLAQQVSPFESKKQNLELWKIVRRVLETEEQITKLAVQFSR